jgi:hypothetical protein
VASSDQTQFLAPTHVLGRRVGAFVLDLGVQAAVYFPLFFALADKVQRVDNQFPSQEGAFAQFTSGDTRWEVRGGSAVVLFAVVLGVGIANHVVWQGLRGATVGKVLTGIRTVNEAGNPPGIGPALVRGLLWIVDAAPYCIPGLVGFIVAVSSPERQRVGDRVANTWVVTAEATGRPPVPLGPPSGAWAPAPGPPPSPPPGPGNRTKRQT